MARKLNETCLIQDIFLDGSSGPKDVPLGSVMRLRQLRMTNRPFSSYNITHTDLNTTSKAQREAEGMLFCRFRFCAIYEDQAQKNEQTYCNFIEKYITSLEPGEIDVGWAVNPPEPTSPSLSDDDVRILSRSSSATLLDDDPKTYTFGDVFCGAGGVSSGAKQAGLKIAWGLERDNDAAQSFNQNFPEAVCEMCSVEQFIQFPAAEYHVDVMHISPPCPSFSPMQTRPGKDFEEKQVVILSVEELVKRIQPRIVTMEETFGLLFERNFDFFATVVRSLNDFGYSVRWKILNLRHYGAPQPRRRLIIIAARYALHLILSPPKPLPKSYPPTNHHNHLTYHRPGEPLPPFPPPTHLHTPNTIADLVSDLPVTTTTTPPTDPLHNPTQKTFPVPRAPYNAHGPLREIIACSPTSGNYHPSGLRAFTVREFACLQTFPRDFRFVGTQTSVLRQIGNAVPPMAAKAIFEEILGCLRRRDEGRL